MPAPLSTALVSGSSMIPTLSPGDCLLVLRSRRVRAGELVVARFPAGPDLLVVKRAVRPVDGGWWVESDNPAVTDDSRRYGAAQVLGRVVLRWWPLPPGRPGGAASSRGRVWDRGPWPGDPRPPPA